MEKRKSTQDLFSDLKKLAIEGDSTALMGIATLASKDDSAMEYLINKARGGNKEAVSHLLTLISENNSKAKEGLIDVIIEADRIIMLKSIQERIGINDELIKKYNSIMDLIIEYENRSEQVAAIPIEKLKAENDDCYASLNQLKHLSASSEISEEEYLAELSKIESRQKEIREEIKKLDEEMAYLKELKKRQLSLEKEVEERKKHLGDVARDNIITYLIDLANNGDTEAMKLLSTVVISKEADMQFTNVRFIESIKDNPTAYECIETILRSEYNSDVNSILLELYMMESILAHSSLHTLADEDVFMAVRDVLSLGLADNSNNEFDRFIELVKSGMPTAAVIARDIIKNSADQYDVEIVDCVKKALSESVNKSDETIELLATLADSGKGSK